MPQQNPRKMDASVTSHGLLNPGKVVADLGVDAWVTWQSAADPPGHDPLELPVAHNWATRITL